MTRRCMDCNAHLGEKCPWCGTENLTRVFTCPDGPVTIDNREALYTCMNACCPALDGARRFQFREGDGPNGSKKVTTTTLCKKCLMKRNAAMRKAHA